MNEKWRSYFNATILKRGRDYVANDCVKSFHISKNDDNVLLINAKVIGSKAYRVSITHDLTSGQWNMECSCPFAKKGNYCKHEAAVLYEYENQANRPKSHQSADQILWREYLDKVYNARCANGQFYFDIRAILGDLEMPMAKWLSNHMMMSLTTLICSQCTAFLLPTANQKRLLNDPFISHSNLAKKQSVHSHVPKTSCLPCSVPIQLTAIESARIRSR